MYCRPAPNNLSSAYTCASSLMASFTRRMSCSWLPGWQCTSCRQSSMPFSRRISTASRISVMNRPNLDLSPAESRHLPEPSLASFTRTPMRGRTLYFSAMLQDRRQLAEVLDHRDDGAAELGGDDHRFEVAVVLEAVADDEALRRVRRHGHDRQQLGLAAHFEAEAERLAVAIHLFDHQALLVHLDREHRGVAILVVVLGDRLRERVVQMLEPVREDVGEAHHHRRRELAFLQSLHDVEQVDLALGVHVRPHHEVPGGVHAEVALAPGVDLVELGGVVDRPGDRSFGASRNRIGCVAARVWLGSAATLARTIANRSASKRQHARSTSTHLSRSAGADRESIRSTNRRTGAHRRGRRVRAPAGCGRR